MTSAIRTENLSKRFRRATALDGLNLDVPEGSIYALVGVNGAGKTTAIKVVMNILRPTRGRSEVLGTDSQRLQPRDFARIGYVAVILLQYSRRRQVLARSILVAGIAALVIVTRF